MGVDVDDEKLAVARAEAADVGRAVEYLQADVTAAELGAGFDLAYVRFLLTHLVDPAEACGRIFDAVRPGGTVIAEDIDVRGCFCHPHSAAYSRFCEIYVDTAHARGCDPHIGPRLPELLRDAGFGQIRVWAAQPVGAAVDGVERDVKCIVPLTLENIADAAVAEGTAERSEIAELTDELYRIAADPETLMSNPRIVQVAARRGTGANPKRARATRFSRAPRSGAGEAPGEYRPRW